MTLIPVHAHAAIIFTEVAWMGSSESANDEWIELHNTGDASVSVDGWTVRDGASLEIELAGSVVAGGYAVLERTDDGSASGPAFLIYTGALPNTGAVLSLYRSDGSLEDQVAGGENWASIGGDNVSKKTPQRTSSGWKTASPTPGAGASATETQSSDEEGEEEEEVITSNQSQKKSEEENVVIELQLPDATLKVDLLAPDVSYVNQGVVFDVQASGLGKTQIASLSYAWNFGDFNTQSGKKVTHTFRYPGEYVVTVRAAFGRHEQVARKTIKVLPVSFSLNRNANGDLLIHNDAKYEVNISGYTLAGTETLTLPERSVILAGGTVTVPKAKLGGSTFVPVTLRDKKDTVVASTAKMPTIASLGSIAPSVPAVQAARAAQPDVTQEEVVQADTERNFLFADEVSVTVDQEAEPQANSLALLPEAEGESPSDLPQGALPLLGLIGIVTVGITAVFLGKKH